MGNRTQDLDRESERLQVSTNHQRTMTRNISDKIKRLKDKIENRLGRLNFELANRAEQVGYTKNPICTPSHKEQAAEAVQYIDVDALNRLNEIKKLHEELFNAELELEKFKRSMECWRATSR